MSGSLNHSQSEIVRQLMIDQSLGENSTTNTWGVFAYAEPNTPDNAITVYNTDGRKDGSFMSDGQTQIFHGVQIRIRANDKRAGYRKANAIAIAMDGISRQTVDVESNQYYITAIRRTGDVTDLGNETPQSKRRIFVINATLSLHQVN